MMSDIEKEIAELFNKWNASLQTGKPEGVVKLYAEDAVLLPTVDNAVRIGYEAIKSYFREFIKLKPKGEIIERHISVLDKNNVADDGLYAFSIVANGKNKVIKARYSFIYEKIKGKWLIKVHHSSQMPNPDDKHYSILNPKRWITWLYSKIK
jgi:uncharacterized protein (TIGR02246 family)